MASTRQQPRVPRESRIVLPTAPKEEETKFGSSNTWGRNELKLLGVDFYMKRRIDLNKVLQVRESAWSPELRARMYLSRESALNDRDSRRRQTVRLG